MTVIVFQGTQEFIEKNDDYVKVVPGYITAELLDPLLVLYRAHRLEEAREWISRQEWPDFYAGIMLMLSPKLRKPSSRDFQAFAADRLVTSTNPYGLFGDLWLQSIRIVPLLLPNSERKNARVLPSWQIFCDNPYAAAVAETNFLRLLGINVWRECSKCKIYYRKVSETQGNRCLACTREYHRQYGRNRESPPRHKDEKTRFLNLLAKHVQRGQLTNENRQRIKHLVEKGDLESAKILHQKLKS